MVHFSPEILWDQLTTGVVAVDHEGRVQAVNTAAERLLGRARRHLSGIPLAQLLPGHPIALDLIHRARNLGMPCRVRTAHLTPSPGVTLSVSLTAVPLEDADGQGIGALLQLEETGTLERIEEGQRLNATLDSMETLALTVAHEVKNPLAGIRGVAQLLEMEGGSTTISTGTALICAEVDRISRLLDALLGLADRHATPSGAVNIHEILDHVVRLCPGDQPRINKDYDPSLPAIRGDRDQLIQLFLNLLQNARDAAGAMGLVCLHTRISTQVRLEQGRRQRHLIIEVRDNGPGIAESVRQRMFLPFVTSKPKGTGNGLGLAIVQKIVHDHGGQIEVTEQAGQTIFRVLLPVNVP
ncbi:two-component system sensor histidine kinase NtrB [Candidatus Magnetaquicoccus inordinatus]|uniref:two-component system sensor histidine kinase NtrB n=1 Tax=Candidatus Magnetaquicoccus inordinatus TaxID=2496818 RepID=UPI00102CD5B7|nr:ATP-binding protein [Candidatus Magnetaquicoccus inordinatus]